MLEDFHKAFARREWFESGLTFECQPDCHKCCLREGIVRLAPASGDNEPSESETLSRELGTSFAEFARQFISRDNANGVFIEDPSDNGCPLWRNGCRVYEVRPFQCRSYPFWPEIVKSERRWNEEAEFCPGIGKGRRYSKEEIRALLATTRENQKRAGLLRA